MNFFSSNQFSLLDHREIGQLYEEEQDLDQAIVFYERSADLFQSEEVTTSANQCKLKVAKFAAQLEQYPKAIEIYEEISHHSLNINILKYNAKSYLLNASLCQLCKVDVIVITNALEGYQDLATSIDEEDVARFTDVVKEFDSTSQLMELLTENHTSPRSPLSLMWIFNKISSTLQMVIGLPYCLLIPSLNSSPGTSAGERKLMPTIHQELDRRQKLYNLLMPVMNLHKSRIFFQRAKPYKWHPTILMMQKVTKELGVVIPVASLKKETLRITIP